MSKLKNDSEQYKKYLSGKMSADEAHTFEREVLNDPFEQEALEGLESIDTDTAFSDIEKLQSQVLAKKKSQFGWMRIAAVVSLLVVSSLTLWLVIDPVSDSQELAMEKPAAEKKESLGNATKTEETVPERVETPEETVEEEPVDTEPEPASTSSPQPIAENKETQEVTVEDRADESQVALADMEVEEDVSEAVVDEAFFNDEDASAGGEALQGQVAGVSVTRSEALKFDTSQVDLTSKLFAEESNVVESADKKAKTAPATGAIARRAFAPAPATITGNVSDDTGEGLPGVSVNIKGTTTGTQTDLDGNYQIEAEQSSTLIFSFVGFETSEVQVGGRENIDMTMGGVTELQEVVVTGYGESTRDDSYTPAKPDGGSRSFKKYLEDNLVYPDSAQTNNIEGTVILELTISSAGRISNIDVKKSLGYGCDEEAIRLVRQGPEWTPANRGGSNEEDKVRVRVRFKN